MPQLESIFITCNDFARSKLSDDAAESALVVAKTVDGKSDYRVLGFGVNQGRVVCSGDGRGYTSVFGIDIAFGPDDEDTALIVSKKTPMVVVITSDEVSGKCKAASSKKTVILNLSEQKDVKVFLKDDYLFIKKQGSKAIKCADYSRKNAPEPPKAEPAPKAKAPEKKAAQKESKAPAKGSTKDSDGPKAQKPDKV